MLDGYEDVPCSYPAVERIHLLMSPQNHVGKKIPFKPINNRSIPNNPATLSNSFFS